MHPFANANSTANFIMLRALAAHVSKPKLLLNHSPVWDAQTYLREETHGPRVNSTLSLMPKAGTQTFLAAAQADVT